MDNIMDITSTAFPGNVLERLNSQIRENPGAIKRGIEQAVPVSLAGLAAHAASEEHAEELLGAIRGGNYPHAAPNEVGDMVADASSTARLTQSSTGFLNRIFGNRLSGIVDALAGQSGLTRAAASTLLGVATPVVLDAVGKEAQSRNLDARGLSRFLADQGRSVSSNLPAPLSTALGTSSFGNGAGTATGPRSVVTNATDDMRPRARGTVSSVRGASADVRGKASDTLHRVEPSARVSDRVESGDWTHSPTARRGFAWRLLVLAAVAAAALLLFARRNTAPRDTAVEKVPSASAAPNDMRATAKPERATPERATPEAPRAHAPGEMLSPATGAGALTAFLTSTDPMPQHFVLDGIEFSSSLSAPIASNRLLDQVAATLAQQPTAKVELKGFPKPVGSAADQGLAAWRATAVKDYLIARGVNASQIETGEGAGRPVPPSETAGARGRDHRIELTVVAR